MATAQKSASRSLASVSYATNAAVPDGTTSKTKVVVLGSSFVGKTAIISQLLNHKFPVQPSMTTELEHHDATLHQKKHDVPIQIIDTPGAHLFYDRRRIAIEEGDAFILVFSLNDEESFITAATLKDDIVRYKSRNTPIILVGNKADLDPECHITSREGGCKFAKREWNTRYVETSARENINIGEIFHELWRQYKKSKSCLHQLFDQHLVKSNRHLK